MELRSKILCVDDCDTNLEIMRTILRDDYLVRTASTGEEALDIADDLQPDITLLDIMMPGIDGYEVCRRMKENPLICNGKIIMVSAKVLLAERLEGYAAGADDYLTKPFSKDELKAKISVFLKMKSVDEVEQLKTEVLNNLNRELGNQLHGILLPTTILKSDDRIQLLERKMLADIIYNNVKNLHTLLEKIATQKNLKTDDSN